MKRLLIIIIIFTTILTNTFGLSSYSSKYFVVNISQFETKIFKQLRIGTYRGKLYKAVFSLVKNGDSYQTKFLNIINKIKTSSIFKNAKNNYQKGDTILQLLHKYLFKMYEGNDASLSSVFNRGIFNCVSSSVIFNMVSDYFGISTSGAVIPSHVFSIVHINGKAIDVEPTVKYGFDTGKRRHIHDEFKRLTGFIYVPPSSPNRRQINRFQLVSYIFSQVGNVEGMNNRHEESLKFFVRSLMIYPKNESGLIGVKIAYYKIAQKHSSEGDYLKGIKVLQELLSLFSEDITIVKGINVFFNNSIIELANKKQFQTVFKLFNMFRNNNVFRKTVKQLEPDMYRRESNHLMEIGKFELALKRAEIGIKRYTELEVLKSIIHNNWITRLVKTSKYLEALKVIEKIGKTNRRIYNRVRYVYGIWVQNLLGQRKYDEAYKISENFYKQYKGKFGSRNFFKKFIHYYTYTLARAGLIDKADKVFKSNKNIFTNNEYNKMYGSFVINSSKLYMNMAKPKKSAKFFIVAVKNHSTHRNIESLKYNYPYKLVVALNKTNNINSAVTLLSSIETVTSKNYVSKARALMYFFIARKYFSNNDYTSSIANIKNGLKYYKLNYLYNLLAQTAVNRINQEINNNNYAKAAKLAEDYLKIDINNNELRDIYKKSILFIVSNLASNNRLNLAIKILLKAKSILGSDYQIEEMLNRVRQSQRNTSN